MGDQTRVLRGDEEQVFERYRIKIQEGTIPELKVFHVSEDEFRMLEQGFSEERTIAVLLGLSSTAFISFGIPLFTADFKYDWIRIGFSAFSLIGLVGTIWFFVRCMKKNRYSDISKRIKARIEESR